MAKGRKTGGRVKGTPNKNTDRRHRLLEALNVDDAEIINGVIRDAKAGDHAARHLFFRFLRPQPARSATFVSRSFELKKLTTIEDASLETLRIAEVVASGDLDHGTGEFLLAAIRAFVETLTGVKTEKEIAATDALKMGGQS
jgi:hypothetical protein